MQPSLGTEPLTLRLMEGCLTSSCSHYITMMSQTLTCPASGSRTERGHRMWLSTSTKKRRRQVGCNPDSHKKMHVGVNRCFHLHRIEKTHPAFYALNNFKFKVIILIWLFDWRLYRLTLRFCTYGHNNETFLCSVFLYLFMLMGVKVLDHLDS